MKFEAIPEFKVLPSDSKTSFHVLLRISSELMESRRPRINLALVLDRSGSMRDSKIAAVKEAATLMLDRLGRTDGLSIVVYGTDVKPLLMPSPALDKEAARRAIEGITTGGATNLSGGLLLGLKLAGKGAGKGTVSRVVLLTDGLANRGVTDAERVAGMAESASRKGLPVSVLGFGEGFNEDFLSKIAHAGGGNFHYIRTSDDVPAAFEKEVGEALSVWAQNVVFTLAPAGGFEVAEILSGFPHGAADGGVEAFAGDVYAGDSRKLLARISGEPAEPGARTVLNARVECDIVERGHEHGASSLGLELEFAREAAAGAPDDAVALEIGLMKSARARQKAIALADAGDFASAKQVLDDAASEMEKRRICAARLGGEIREMKRFAAAFAERQWTADSRKSLSASVFLSRSGKLMSTRKGLIETRIDEDK